MKKLRLCAFLLCATMLITLLPATARADTPIVEYVDYDITADTTWHAGDYYICKVGNREPQITNGATLTIESGAKVYFSTRTTATLPGTEGDPKNPYSSLTVTKGTLSATGVTFTTVPDSPEETTWQDAGWNGIRAVGAGEAGTTSLSFTNCTFEYSGFNDDGTLYGVQSNGINSEVNISVTDCTFRNPNAGTTAIRYSNGHNTIGSGTVSVSNSSFTGYGRGVQVEQNGDDAINTTVTDCTFFNISIRPLEINGGRQTVITGNSFNNFVTGQHDYPILIYDGFSPTSTEQMVTLTDNTFNYGSNANIYPVVIGAGCKINEDITSPTITFGTDYPAVYRYIVLSRGVGYLNNHRNAVWGDAGIPYLLASEITITGSDEANKSSLTIKPGVTVCLGDGSGSDNLAVRGDLTAIGTAAKPITFTKKSGVTYGSEIAVSNTLRGSVTLKNCVMDGLYRGIGVISPSTSAGLISLENCTVRNTQEPIVLNGHKVLVKDCSLIGKGIWIDGVSSASSIMIEGCSITVEGDNSDFGVGIRSTKSVTLKNCLIAGFGDCGVAIINNSYQTFADGAPLIENCTVSGNRNGVVYSKTTTFTRYGTYIRNSIISDNTELDLANKVYITGASNYPVTIVDGSIAFSLIGDDGSSLTFDGSGHYEHPVLGKIIEIATSVYSNRITGDPLLADTTRGDYHLKSAAGRWNGSTWVTDAVTSPCIDAGDPASAYANEPVPNGEHINLGCYGNTAEASKSAGGGTMDTTPPSWSAGSTLTASAITQTGATLSWSGASDDNGVTAYRLYQDGGLVHTTSNTFYAVYGLSSDTDYSFKVEAGDAAGNWSTDGPITPVHTLAAITPSVTVAANPSCSVGIGTAVTLTATSTGIASPSYQWYSNTTASSTGGNQIFGATNANYQPSTAMAGTIYYYCVVNGVTSNVMGVTVTSASPVTYTITATASTGGSISPKGAVTVTKGVNQIFIITPNSNYSIANVTVDGVSQGRITSYTFDNITANHTIAATFSYNGGGSGSEDTDRGGSSSVSSPIIVTPPAPDKPNAPTQGEIKVPGTVYSKGNVTVNITNQIVTDAFDKALADAKKNGNEQNGITLILHVDIGSKTGSNVTVNLPKTVQNTIIAKKIVNIVIVVDNPDIRIGIDLATVQEINKQAKSDVNITATRMVSGKLTGDAKKAIGSRPVFDLKVNFGGGKQVQNFGSGGVSVTIPYTLGANEKAGNVQAVYVDANGKVHWLINSVYDSAEQVLRFATSHFSIYGIGYKQTNTAFTDIAGHWAKEDIEFVVSRGLFSGTSTTTFSPNTAMTRGMFVTALGRLANADVSSYKQSSFTDVKSDAYYMCYIEWASKNNIVNGVGNGKFAPDQSITREQMAVIMSNYAKTIGYALPKVHTENTFADIAKISAYAKDAVKQMQMAGVINGKNGNLFDPQGTATRDEVSAVLRRFVELAISSDTMQGWTRNDSGRWMYYENGKPVTGKKEIDGSIYTFDQYGVTTDVPKNLKYATYTVQKGDSFWLIAHKVGCTMSELERLNNKSRFALIHPGDVLRVPEK